MAIKTSEYCHHFCFTYFRGRDLSNRKSEAFKYVFS